MKVPMKTAASFVGVLAVLGLVLLLVPAAQSQQTKPSVKTQVPESKPKDLLQDDIKVKPKGVDLYEGWEWSCGSQKCKDGSELFLRDDLFFEIDIFRADQPKASSGSPMKSPEDVKDLEAVRFTIPLVIEVKRGGARNAYFEWFMDGKPLLDLGFMPCEHGTPKCKDKDNNPGSGIPVTWLNGVQRIEVKYNKNDDYVDLGEAGTVHMKGKP